MVGLLLWKIVKVNWDDEIPNIWKHKTCSKPSTRYAFKIKRHCTCHGPVAMVLSSANVDNVVWCVPLVWFLSITLSGCWCETSVPRSSHTTFYHLLITFKLIYYESSTDAGMAQHVQKATSMACETDRLNELNLPWASWFWAIPKKQSYRSRFSACPPALKTQLGPQMDHKWSG